MHLRSWTALLLACFIVVTVADVTHAIPRRRRSYNNYGYNYYYSSGSARIATKADDANHRPLKVYCDYDRAKRPEFAFQDKIRVHLHVWEQDILNASEPVVAEVRISDLSNSQQETVRYVPVTISEAEDVDPAEYKLGVFDVTNEEAAEPIVKPGKVYRLFINLHRSSPQYDETTALGRVAGPYYVVTSGDSILEQARQRIVMRTFREWYYTERGWHRNAEYPMDCHAYYCWATGLCTVNARNGWSNPDSLFGAFHGSGDVPGLMKAEGIHGDYVRVPGHTFMLLAYDEAAGQVWTMEANFNSTIEVCLRSLGSGWSVGHLAEHHILSDLFHVAANDKEEDMMAQGHTAEPEGEAVMTQ